MVALDPQRYNFANLFYEAVGDEPAGKVLVLASNGHTDTSMGGGTKLFRLEEHELAGVLTDGRLRDFEELAGYDFAAYCSGEATHWGGDVVTPFQANVPVVVGGVGVTPGQFVYADAAGAVVIPEGEVDDVLAEARKIEAADEAFRAAIAAEIGVEPTRRNVRFESSRTRPRVITTSFRIRDASGVGRNAECAFDRRTGELTLTRETSASSLAAARTR